MTVLQVKIFLCVWQTKKYSDAADELGLSQSNLSKQLKALEDEFLVKLFEKTARGVEPTDAAISLYPHFLYIMRQYQDILLKIQDLPTTEELELKLGSQYFTMQYNIMPMIKRFTDTHKNVHVSIHEVRALELQDMLDKKLVDAIFIYKELLQKEYRRIFPIKSDVMVAVMNPDHPFSGRESIGLRELQHERFLLMRGDLLLYNYFLNCCINVGFVPKELEVNLRLETMKSLMKKGSSITLLMKSMADSLAADGSLAVIPIEEEYRLTLSLVLANQTPSLASRRFAHSIELAR